MHTCLWSCLWQIVKLFLFFSFLASKVRHDSGKRIVETSRRRHYALVAAIDVGR